LEEKGQERGKILAWKDKILQTFYKKSKCLQKILQMLQTLYKNTNNTNTIDIDIDIVIDIWVRFVRLTPYENFFAPCGRSIK
jgi:hypothetical protein